METGVVRLTNTKQYPFNDSAVTVALNAEREDAGYIVFTEAVQPDSCLSGARVFDKAVNGFRIELAGAEKTAEIKYYVIGGL